MSDSQQYGALDIYCFEAGRLLCKSKEDLRIILILVSLISVICETEGSDGRISQELLDLAGDTEMLSQKIHSLIENAAIKGSFPKNPNSVN